MTNDFISLLKRKFFSVGFGSILLFAALLYAGTMTSCHRNPLDDKKLSFSSDTLLFDTVFTTTTSITKNFTVYNPNSEAITVDIALSGGSQSYYSINVDGVAGYQFDNVEIAAHDSIFVFVKVLINPVNQNNPYLITDSVMFSTDTRRQAVQLVAYGQDAHFIVADHHGSLNYKIVAGAHETVHWTNDKPWVIYGWAAVDSLGTLIIDPGTRVYVHSGGGIWVYRYGNIQVNGTAEQPVYFAGDRRESFYATDYSQWNRIWINEGTTDNVINHAVITNASIGLQVSALEEYLGNKTIVNNTIIQNNGDVGVLGWAANIEMNNCQISNNASYSLLFQIGQYRLNHVTVANYFTQSARTNPAVVLSNYYIGSDATYIGDAELICNNTIIDGTSNNEFSVSTADGASLDYTFHNCIVRRESLSDHFVNCQRSSNVQFIDNYKQDYQLQSNSPAIDAGMTGLGITTDLLGRARNGVPDIGAYEYYPATDNKRLSFFKSRY